MDFVEWGIRRLLTRYYMNMKIKRKLFLSLVITILLTILMLSIANYYVSTYTIKQNALQQSKYTLNQIAINLENRTSNIENDLFTLYKDEMLYKYLRTKEALDSINFSNALLNFINYSEPYVKSIIIVDRQHKQFTMNRQGQTNKVYLTDQESESVEKELRDLWGAAKWAKGIKETVYMKRALYDLDTTEYAGYMIVEIDAEYLIDVYTKQNAKSIGSIVVLSAEKEIMLYKDDSDVEKVNRLIGLSAVNKVDKAFISSEVHSSNMQWILYNIIPTNELTGNLASLRYWSIITFFSAIALASLLAFLISNHISSNVKLLLSSIRAVAKGDIQVRIQPKGTDEIGLLGEEFNRMSAKMEVLMERIREEQMLKQRTEYRMLEFKYNALQAQMNPHFLYNTLESINSLAKMSGSKKISKLVIALGSMLRESIKKKGKFVTVEQELHYVKNYLSIYKVIYEDRLQVEYEVDERLYQAVIPNFILQPIVENSIVHGIERKVGKGVIFIRAFSVMNLLHIEIQDNGTGMSQEKINSLLMQGEESKADMHSKHTRVGIRSVVERLQLIYGGKCEFEMESEEQFGTIIRFILPLMYEFPQEVEEIEKSDRY